LRKVSVWGIKIHRSAAVRRARLDQLVVHAHPINALSEKHRAGLFILCCVHDTKVARLDGNVALKLDLRTVGVGGHYVPATGKLLSVSIIMVQPWFPILKLKCSCLDAVTSKVQ